MIFSINMDFNYKVKFFRELKFRIELVLSRLWFVYLYMDYIYGLIYVRVKI